MVSKRLQVGLTRKIHKFDSMCETSESIKMNAAQQAIPYINDKFTKETRSNIRSATFLVQLEVMSPDTSK